MTLVQAHKLRDAVLIPLGKISEYTDRWADLELLLMELVEGVEVMSCCDISEAEASRLIELEDILLPQIDWQYQAILRRFDEAIYDETDDDYDEDLERV